MRFVILIFFVFSTSSCSNHPDGEVIIYAIDMMNDMDYRYRIFRVVTSQDAPDKLIDGNFNLELQRGSALGQEISNMYLSYDSNDKEIIGRDVMLIFTSSKAELEFYSKVGIASRCYIYELKGLFKNDKKFFVKQFHHIPMRPTCIKESRSPCEYVPPPSDCGCL